GWKPAKPIVFLNSAAAERAPMFSPDGRWLAYMSAESGRDEIYVRPFPACSSSTSSMSSAALHRPSGNGHYEDVEFGDRCRYYLMRRFRLQAVRIDDLWIDE